MACLGMEPAVVTETGRRENNEDAAFASARLAAVADGVGGAAAGEVASRLAIQKMIALDKRRLEHPLEEEIRRAISDINDAIELAVVHDAAHAGMATTLTAVALSNEGDYLIANVGDSRTYLLRDGRLRRLTRDDSLVQELIDRGALTEVDAQRHPQRSVVLAALDGADLSPPAIDRVQARAGDRLLLCSDGVSDYTSDARIAEILLAADPHDAARSLVEEALRGGGQDNLTALVADVVPRDRARDGWLTALPAPAVGR